MADTWTFGLVASLANNMTWSFDWYKVEIEDAIMLYSLTYAGYRCFGGAPVTNAAEAAEREPQRRPVSNVPRDLGNGNALNALLSYDNRLRSRPRAWTSRGTGSSRSVQRNLGFNLQATILDYYKTKQSPAPFDVETDWAGSLGPNLSGTNAGAYDYRLFGSVNYSRNDWNVALRWRHLPSVFSAQLRNSAGDQEEQRCVAAGGRASCSSYTPTTEYRVGRLQPLRFVVRLGYQRHAVVPRRYHELVRYRARRWWAARRAIRLRSPTWRSVCESLGAPPGCRTLRLAVSQGCTDPVAFGLPGYVPYNPGYYDTLGRRFFIGLSMQF